MEKTESLRTIKINISTLLNETDIQNINNMFIQLTDIYKITLKTAKTLKTTSSVVLNKQLYKEIKEKFENMPTAYIQTIRNSVIGAVKSFNTKNSNKKYQIKEYKGIRKSIPMDKRTLSQRGSLITFSTINKRKRLLINIPNWFKEKYNIINLQSGTLTKNKYGYFLNLTYKIKFNNQNNKGEEVIGIDRGLYNIIALSNGEIINSKKIRENKRRHLYNRSILQQKCTKSAKRKLKKIAGKEKRFMQDINHCISKKLSQKNNVKFYILENLTGIRKQKKGKKINKWISDWSFFQLERFISYKCEDKGIQIKFVDPAYTSQTCNICGNISSLNRNKNIFRCCMCGNKDQADINAAKNIRDKYLLSLVRETGCFQPTKSR